MRAAAYLLAAALGLAGQAADATPPNVILAAEYTEPTTRYDHGILGDAVEWGALKITVDMCAGCANRMVRDFVIRLPETRVFEDVAPRVVDLDGEGSPDVIVVESDHKLGARLAIYNESGLVAATEFIGRRNRWLAPIGAADLDGDGQVEIAYIDRPHLVKALRVFRYNDGALTEIASLDGLTNHRIGERDIGGGIRTCNGMPEMIVASHDWRRVMAVTLQSGVLDAKDIGAHKGRASLNRALECK